MADFADSLIKNLGLYASPKLPTSVNLTEKLNQLGETLRYARTSLSITSISQALTNQLSIAHAPEPPTMLAPPAPEQAKGRLLVNLVEARNLAIVDPTKSSVYGLIQYEKSVISTLDVVENDDKTMPARATSIPIPNAPQRSMDVFQLAMEASCPKWRCSATLDVCNEQEELIVSVYDAGDRTASGHDRFLGTVTIKPSLAPKKTTDHWYRLGPKKAEQVADNDNISGEIRLQTEYTTVGTAKLSPEAFRIVRLLGHGSFGKVFQVVKRDSKRTYAMKVLSKRLLVEQNEVRHTLSERNVLIRTLSSPFIVTLKFSFQTADHLFLVMDYIPGGELFAHMQRERFLCEKHAQFYIAELVCALEHVHAHNVVYRDLKPENILLDAQGHIALTDFGLCKELNQQNDKATTFCGTSEYLAPEMVLQKPYTCVVDWWGLGILLYELLTGGAPFHSVHLDVLYRRICNAPLKFPSSPTLSPEAKDLITRLLDRNPATRLGAKGAAEIKRHPFFHNVQWDLVAQKKTQPPYKPTTQQNSIHNTHKSSTQPSFLNKNTTSSSPLSPTTQSAFKGFSYVRDDAASITSSRRTVASSLFSDEDDDDMWSTCSDR